MFSISEICTDCDADANYRIWYRLNNEVSGSEFLENRAPREDVLILLPHLCQDVTTYVEQALENGFSHIDTAACTSFLYLPKHMPQINPNGD